MIASTSAPSDRDRAILRSFADRIDAYDAGAANNLGVLYFTRGMVDESAAMFTRALDLDPRMTVAQRNLEIVYFTSGYYDRRVQELSARLEVAADDRDARWEYGRTCLLLGDVSRALDAFGTLLRETPDDIQVIRQVATAELKSGDLEAAERWLVHALELAPDNPAALLQRGEVAYHRGLNEVARLALERCVSLASDDADAWYLLGFVRGDQGDHEGAMAARQRAMRLNPSLGRARANLSLERFDARSWQRAAEVKAARGLATPPSGTPMPHYHLALAFRQKGYFAEAEREYRLALDGGEEREVVLPAMAELALLRGDMSQAVALYDELLAAAPGRARYWNERGVALHHLGRLTDALASYHRAVDADPAALSAQNNLAVAAFHAGDAAQAAAVLAKVVELEPANLRARLNAALVCVRQEEHAQALANYRAVIEQERDHPVAWNGVGLVLTKLKRFAHARDAFSRAIEARDDYAEAHYNLGFVLSQLGEHDAAFRETRRAMEIDSFYTPQGFELAVDFAHETPLIQVAPDAPTEPAVPGFAPEIAELEASFDALEHGPTPRDDVDALLVDARDAMARGEFDAAHAALREAIAAPGNAVEALLLQGEAFLGQGMAGEAIERFRLAQDAAPGRTDALAGELRALVVAHREDETESLMEALADATDLDGAALVAMATVHVARGRSGAARAAVTRARAAAPTDPIVLRSVAAIARDLGDTADAVAALRAALATDRASVDVSVDLAGLLQAGGEVAEAEAVLVDACGHAPTHVAATLALSRLRRADGRAAETILPLADFLLADPWQLDVLASLAESLSVCERRVDARIAVDRVLRFDPDHPVALYVDGVLRVATFDFAGAIARWDHLLAVEPSSSYARRAEAARAEAASRRAYLVGEAVSLAGRA